MTRLARLQQRYSLRTAPTQALAYLSTRGRKTVTFDEVAQHVGRSHRPDCARKAVQVLQQRFGADEIITVRAVGWRLSPTMAAELVAVLRPGPL